MPGRVKGSAFLESVRVFEAQFGRARLEAALARIPERWRASFDLARPSLGLLVGTWYPNEQAQALIEAMLADMPATQRTAFARDCAEAIVRHQLRGLYRVIFDALVTPERYAAHAHRLWTMMNDTGRLEQRLVDDHTVQATVRGWVGHHPFACALATHVGVVVYRELGCVDVVAQHRCLTSTGADHCAATIMWRHRS